MRAWRTTICALTLAAIGVACGSPADGAGSAFDRPAGVPDGYELVFFDDFDGDELDEAWTTCYWWQVDGGCTISSNDEQQWYRPEAVSLDDGVVRLTASDTSQEASDGAEMAYTSGMISTGHVDNDVRDPGFAFTYGYVEATVRFPDGEGTWPAVWLLSADRTSLPEIDLIEWYGSRPDVVTSHVHQRVDGERTSERVEVDVVDAGGNWHDVAVLWEPDRVVFFLDGVSTGVVDDAELVPSTPMYLIVNLAMGGIAGGVDDEALPQSMLVDHVAVWQTGGDS